MRRLNTQSGFTIIELLIATAVFSVILLVVTSGILQFSKQYYKGVISSTTQGVTRTIIDDITRAIEFNGGFAQMTSNNGSSGYCVGSGKRYSFALNQQVTDVSPDTTIHQGKHALVSDNLIGCSAATQALDVTTTLPPGNNIREQLGQHMRLNKFAITENSPGLYTVVVRVVYGDDDLLCSPSVANDCSLNMSAELDTADDLNCKPAAGSQFCAVSELETTVKKRVN